MSNVMTISKRTASGLEEVLRTLLLDSENKVPAERLRIVGAIADGAIIEQGSNSNGEWIRLANGTQVCWSLLAESVDIIYGADSLYRSETIWRTYPAAFIAVPSVAVGLSVINEASTANIPVLWELYVLILLVVELTQKHLVHVI